MRGRHARALIALFNDTSKALCLAEMANARLAGRLDEGRALLPSMFAAARRFGTPDLAPQFCSFAVAELRFGAAAQLLGYVRQSYESCGMTLEPDEGAGLAPALATAEAALGVEQVQMLVQQGRLLGDNAAELLPQGWVVVDPSVAQAGAWLQQLPQRQLQAHDQEREHREHEHEHEQRERRAACLRHHELGQASLRQLGPKIGRLKKAQSGAGH